MFLNREIFSRLLQAYDSHLCDMRQNSEKFLDLQRKQTEANLGRVLAIKDGEVKAILAAKEEEVKFLKQQVSDLQQAVMHERSRAEAAIDRLLTRDAHVPPVRLSDVEREIAERDAKHTVKLDPEKKLDIKRVFEEVNSVLEDREDGDPLSLLASVGGMRVGGEDASE